MADERDPDGVSELTGGDQQIVRVAAPDLQQARRVRSRIRAGADDVAVILDVTVAVAGDFRAAQQALGPLKDGDVATVHYVARSTAWPVSSPTSHRRRWPTV